jgi:RNA binding exosome subunit
MDKSDIDKDLLEFQRIAMKRILNETKYKLFFTQSEFEQYYGEIIYINYLHNKLQEKYNNEKYLENLIIKIQEKKKKK